MTRQFRETQRFDQWWITLLFLVIPVYFIVRSYQSLTWYNVLLAVGLPVLILYVIYLIRLRTVIDHRRIRIKFFPLANRNISWDDVDSAEIINYGFVGGFGVRKNTQYGTVYSTKGSWGLFIVLKNGRRLIIGTQRPESLKRFLMNYVEFEQ